MSHNSLRWDVSVGGCTKKERKKDLAVPVWRLSARCEFLLHTQTEPDGLWRTQPVCPWTGKKKNHPCLSCTTPTLVWRHWHLLPSAVRITSRFAAQPFLSGSVGVSLVPKGWKSPWWTLAVCGRPVGVISTWTGRPASATSEPGDVQRGPSWGPCANRESGNRRPVTAAVCQLMDGSAFCSWHEPCVWTLGQITRVE